LEVKNRYFLIFVEPIDNYDEALIRESSSHVTSMKFRAACEETSSHGKVEETFAHSKISDAVENETTDGSS